MTAALRSCFFLLLAIACMQAPVAAAPEKGAEALPADALDHEPLQALGVASEAMPEVVTAVDENVRAPGPEYAAYRPVARPRAYPSITHALLAGIRPKARPYILPKTRWEHRPGNKRWTKAAMQAVLSHGRPLVSTVPRDYKTWCPAYKDNDEYRRAMFWVGFMSALAKHESTYRADAVGGGGLWYGLLQILPSTARLYRCKASTGEALKDGADNLTCAVRIMTKTVARDEVIHGFYPDKKRRYQGVTQDWGPMHSAAKRSEMAAWTRKQAYCVSRKSLRPKLRPSRFEQAETSSTANAEGAGSATAD